MFENDDRKQEQKGSGYINLETMLGLNQQQGEQMGQKVTGQAQDALDKANTSLNAGEQQFTADVAKAPNAQSAPHSFGDSAPEVRSQVAAARQAISHLDSPGGNAQALGSAYGKGTNYSAAQKGFDAFLSGTSIGAAADHLKSGLGGLENRLGLDEANAQDAYQRGEGGRTYFSGRRQAAIDAQEAENKRRAEEAERLRRDHFMRSGLARRGHGDLQNTVTPIDDETAALLGF